MDAFVLSQMFGTAALGFRVGGLYLQSRFADAQRMRLSVIPTHIMTAISYAFSGAPTASIAYSGAATRSALLSTHWGNKHKNLISVFNVAAVGAATALMYENPKDLLPAAGTAVATLGDYQPQGRYNRLTYLLGRSFVWIPMAALNKNWAMAATEIVSLGIQLNAIYKHDVRRACGLENGRFLNNFRAYLHGIFHDSATGAERDGQISKNAGHAPADIQYLEKLNKTRNPHFIMQQELLDSAMRP